LEHQRARSVHRGQQSQEKMDVFSKELLRVGTLKGFLHFHCYLRGREELMVTIPRENKEEIVQVSDSISMRVDLYWIEK
jgi:hypothetical protein